MTPSFAIIGAGLLTLAFAVLVQGLFRRREDEGLAEWFETFTLDVYRPMLRLLNGADAAFLAQQPGYTVRIGAKLRNERREIFRSYLWEMFQDYNRLLRVGRLIVVHSERDRPDLARTLFRLRLSFYWNWAFTQIQLAAFPFPPSPVSARRLIALIEAVQASLPIPQAEI